MYYPDTVVEEVRSANNIVDVIGSYVKLQKKGSSYFGLCPFHNEKTGSFSVSEEKQMYYCFGCGAGGNVITFLMEYENFSFPEALKYLADRAGISLPEEEESASARREADKRQTILKIYKEAATFYYAMLVSERGKLGLAYLKNRGLSDETIRRFGLGYSDKYADSLYRHIKKEGYPDELLKETGLFSSDEKHGMTDKFWNRVMFPIMDINNKVIAFGGRVMGDAKPKYLNSPETMVFDKSKNLYGLNIARRAKGKKLILCEGYMDVIALHQAGFSNAVASLGTSFTTGQAQLIRRYADSVFLVYDSDDAGVRAILRALPILRQHGLDALVVNLKPHKDPDEFIKNLGNEAFQERLDQAENGFLFSIRMIERDYDLQKPEQKTRFMKRAADELLVFEEEVEREAYIQAVASRYMVSAESLRALVSQQAMKGSNRTPSASAAAVENRRTAKKVDSALLGAQKLLLAWMAENPDLFATVQKYIFPEDFSEGVCRTSAEILYQQARAGHIEPASIVSRFSGEEEQKEAASVFYAPLQRENTRDALREIKEAMMRIKRASVAELSASMNPADLGEMQKLISSKQALQKLEKIDLTL